MTSLVRETLDYLLQENAITGYNYFPRKLSSRTRSRLILSNLHETDAYLADVTNYLTALGYPNEHTSLEIRAKFASARWLPQYRIHDDFGNVYPQLKIHDDNKILTLSEIPFQTLSAAGFSKEYIQSLIGKNKGYEIVLSSRRIFEIRKLADIFLEKAYNGSLEPWTDAYSVPYILIEGCTESVPSFEEITLYRRMKGKEEYNFVALHLSQETADTLSYLGFIPRGCLVNKIFIDELRKSFKS